VSPVRPKDKAKAPPQKALPHAWRMLKDDSLYEAIFQTLKTDEGGIPNLRPIARTPKPERLKRLTSLTRLKRVGFLPSFTLRSRAAASAAQFAHRTGEDPSKSLPAGAQNASLIQLSCLLPHSGKSRG
jgi:hypothetical protein